MGVLGCACTSLLARPCRSQEGSICNRSMHPAALPGKLSRQGFPARWNVLYSKDNLGVGLTVQENHIISFSKVDFRPASALLTMVHSS